MWTESFGSRLAEAINDMSDDVSWGASSEYDWAVVEWNHEQRVQVTVLRFELVVDVLVPKYLLLVNHVKIILVWVSDLNLPIGVTEYDEVFISVDGSQICFHFGIGHYSNLILIKIPSHDIAIIQEKDDVTFV